MIRKGIYIFFGICVLIFLVWINYISIKNIISENTTKKGILTFIIEGLIFICIIIAIIIEKWNDFWIWIDDKDEKIKKNIIYKKDIKNKIKNNNLSGSLSTSRKDKTGWLS